jgi:hypothetical protein
MNKNNYGNYRYVPGEKESIVYIGLMDLGIGLNKWGLPVKESKNGFLRYDNIIFDCLQVADVTFAEYKIFNYVFRYSVGWNKSLGTEYQRYEKIASQIGLTRMSVIRGFRGCIEKRMLHRYDMERVINGKVKWVPMIKINSFPDLWRNVGDEVKKVAEKNIISLGYKDRESPKHKEERRIRNLPYNKLAYKQMAASLNRWRHL